MSRAELIYIVIEKVTLIKRINYKERERDYTRSTIYISASRS
jgi:hypothetical protein